MIRKATMADAEVLFQWKNDKTTIENSITRRGVTMDEHLKWLENVLQNPKRQLFIFEVEGKSAGQLRLDIDGKTAEISYGLGEEFRKKGLGKELLKQAEEIAGKYEIEILYGEVLPHNKASQNLFKKLGYVEKITAGIFEYRKNISKIYIRVDMNETIATGHVMRCLSIADAAREMGKETVFITADEKPAELLRNRGYEPLILHTNWDDMEAELEVLVPLVQEMGITKLLVDSYQVTNSYLERLEEVTEVFYLDDVDAFEYPVSNVICYANYYSKLSYGSYKRDVNFYLGTSYMPIRKVFQNCKSKEIKEKIENILILSGGSDSFHMLEHIAELVKHIDDIQADVICGAFYPDFDGLREKFAEYANLHFYQNVSNLDVFMEKADLAISAGGTTLYELCAKGTPTISYAFADNQLRNVEQFDKDEMIEYAGDVRYDDVYGNIMSLYEKYRNPNLRKKVSEKMQKVMDGQGAARIAALL